MTLHLFKRFESLARMASLCLVLLSLFLMGCQSSLSVESDSDEFVGVAPQSVSVDSNLAIDLRRPLSVDALVEKLAQYQVIYLGEQHDRFEQHLMQARVIEALHRKAPNLVIAMEQFQRPSQGALDEFVAGEMDEAQLLQKSEWYRRWRYDFRLYRPILALAREKQIPIVALNADMNITRQVGEVGLGGLAPGDRAQLAKEMHRPSGSYLDSLTAVFNAHSGKQKRSFERFVEVQMIWDETMAEGIVQALEKKAGTKVVVLVGSGHVQYNWGIPSRVERRLPNVAQTVVLQADGALGRGVDPHSADWLIDVTRQDLPAKGSIGMLMKDEGGSVLVVDVVADSGGDLAGLKKGDRVTALDDFSIRTTADVRLRLLDKVPGDDVFLQVRRDEDGVQTTQVLKITLQGQNSHHGSGYGLPVGKHSKGDGKNPRSR